ncbi:MAG: DUF4214 domain-containing protein, partial [Sulfitobacter sp.]
IGANGWASASGESEFSDIFDGTISDVMIVNGNYTPSEPMEPDHNAPWSDEVFRVYQAALNRMPDAIGFEGWTEKLGDGLPLLNVVEVFVNSAEFQTKYGATDTTEFVTLLYNNVLNRGTDPTGLVGWSDRLDSQGWTRAEVVLGIAQSGEFVIKSTQNLIDWMRGSGIDDELVAGAGDNVLVGGMYSDRFVFEASSDGNNRVTDLEAWDEVAFNGFGYANDTAARGFLSQSGDDVVFADQGVSVTFENATLGMFTDDLVVL